MTSRKAPCGRNRSGARKTAEDPTLHTTHQNTHKATAQAVPGNSERNQPERQKGIAFCKDFGALIYIYIYFL